MNVDFRIGFMQGRLSPIVNGRIQSFPWNTWREEFATARQQGFRLVEWTLDQERLYGNPLLTLEGQAEIRSLCQQYGFTIPSLTGDCFMQAPFWKAGGAEREALQRDFLAVGKACAAVGISIMVVPLVDNGRLENAAQEDALVSFLQAQSGFFADNRLRVAFESDFAPGELGRFIGRLDPALFGVNYDIGNSAAFGYNPVEELGVYGRCVINVHVKDRLLGGTTVALGTGNADFKTVFAALDRLGYTGSFILQTARAADGNHLGALCRYRDMVENWINHHEA